MYSGASRAEVKALQATTLRPLGKTGLTTTLLGGGMSSRLFQSVRENAGLCYSIYTFAEFARGESIFIADNNAIG